MYLQRQHLLVDAIKCRHSKCPGQQAGHVPADFLGTFKGVVIHVKIWLQQLHRLLVDGVLGELLQAPQEPCGAHQLQNTPTRKAARRGLPAPQPGAPKGKADWLHHTNQSEDRGQPKSVNRKLSSYF